MTNEEILKKINELEKEKKKHDVINESSKISINGTFGKLGSIYSSIYSPDLMISVTITGQLSLLMLIDELERNGINVVSANTDGFVSFFKKDKLNLYNSICFDWEMATGFNLEDTYYKMLYSRDVNNYVGIKYDGKTKRKGIFKINDIAKNPQTTVSINAAIDYLSSRIPISDSIKNCKTLTDFFHVRSVTGGAIWKGQYLGRVIRWIYSTNGEIITYKKANKTGTHPKVPNSDGARPIMSLNCEFPEDIDYDRYIEEAKEIVKDFGIDV